MSTISITCFVEWPTLIIFEMNVPQTDVLAALIKFLYQLPLTIRHSDEARGTEGTNEGRKPRQNLYVAVSSFLLFLRHVRRVESDEERRKRKRIGPPKFQEATLEKRPMAIEFRGEANEVREEKWKCMSSRFTESEKNVSSSSGRRPATLYVQSTFPCGIISRPPSWKRQMFLRGFVGGGGERQSEDSEVQCENTFLFFSSLSLLVTRFEDERAYFAYSQLFLVHIYSCLVDTQ